MIALENPFLKEKKINLTTTAVKNINIQGKKT